MMDTETVEVGKLEAGRELDMRIALEVMGWAILRSTPRGAFVENEDGDAVFVGDKGVFLRPWSPSSSIEHAFQVVEKLRSPDQPDGYCEFTIRSEGTGDNGLWEVFVGVKAAATAPTLPLAICRAALQACTK